MKTIDPDALQEMRVVGAKVRNELSLKHHESARLELERGWDLIPNPKKEYENSLSFVRAAIRLMALSGKPALALRWIDEIGNLPFSEIDAEPEFLIGVTFFELKNLDLAFDHFDRAGKMSKGRCFQGEDKKYLDFYKKRAAGG